MMENIEELKKSLSIAKAKRDKPAQIEAYRNLGGAYQSIGNFPEAIKYHNKSLDIAIKISDKYGEQKAYGNLGIVHIALMKYDEGFDYLQKSLSIAEDLRDKRSEGLTNMHLGNAFYALKKNDEALECYQNFLRIVTEVGDKDGEKVAYLNLGNALSASQKYLEADEHYKKFVRVALEIGDKNGVIGAYGQIGIFYKDQGRYEEAIEYLEKCLLIAKETGDLRIEGNTYGQLGSVYTSLAKYQKAIEHYERCIDICKKTGNIPEEAITYGSLGQLYNSLGVYNKGIEYAERCSQIALSIGDTQNHGKALGVIGNAHHYLGNYQHALRSYKEQCTIAEELGDQQEVQSAYGNLGSTYIILGEYDVAIHYHTLCLSIAEALHDAKGECLSCGRLGIAYFSLGKYREATDFWIRELAISTEIGYKEGEAAAYGNLANSLHLVGQYTEALRHSKKALDLAKERGDRKSEATAYNGLGQVYVSTKELSKGFECFQKSLALAKEIGDRQTEGIAYSNLGNACKASEKYDEAIQYYEKGLDIQSSINDRGAMGPTHFNIAMCYKSKPAKSNRKAKEHLEKSIRCCEVLFKSLGSNDSLKISIVDTYIESYKTLTQVCTDNGDNDEAILVSERGRARALEDLLSTKYAVNSLREPDTGSLELLKQGVYDIIDMTLIDYSILYYDVSPKKDTIQSWVPAANPNPSFCVRRDVSDFQSSSDDDEDEISKEANIHDVIEKSYDVMKVRGVQKCEDRSLGIANTAGVSELETMVELPNSPESAVQPEATEETNKGVPKSRCIYEVDEDEKPLVSLYEMLISPVEDKLIQDEVVIIPDGDLFMVPFAALQNPKTGKYLSETKRIRLMSSLTTLKIFEESSQYQQNMSGALIVGNPDIGKVMYRGKERSFANLDGAENEANKIAGLLGVEPLTRKTATKEKILERLQQGVSVVHFAAHGETENGQILLAPSPKHKSDELPEEKDYILTINEAQESRLRAQLVVLSCCHSGKGDIRSEGVVGMARAFLAAGARAVIASLWAIDDNATMYFMLKFYSHLIKGESASLSLQHAMTEMRESIFSDPMYWAAFFLIGDDVTINLEASDQDNGKQGCKCSIA